MEIKEGDVLVHKASGLKMVVLCRYSPCSSNVKCRYYNQASGAYETADFETIEFVEIQG